MRFTSLRGTSFIPTLLVMALLAVPQSYAQHEGPGGAFEDNHETSGEAGQLVLSPEETLALDAQSYARVYGVPHEEAARRILIMHGTDEQIAALEADLGPQIASVHFDHGSEFRLVVRHTGQKRRSQARLVHRAERLTMAQAPSGSRRELRRRAGLTDEEIQTAARVLAQDVSASVVFHEGAKHQRNAIRQLIRQNRATFRKALPGLQGLGYDQRSGEIFLDVFATGDAIADAEAKEAELEALVGVPIRIEVTPALLEPRTLRGGEPLLNSSTGGLACTTAFVAKDANLKLGVLTAGHCPDTMTFRTSSGTSYTLTKQRGGFTPNYDIQFMTGSVGGLPEFYAQKGELPRTLTGRRTRANTNEKTTTQAGSFICHYGRATGPVVGQSCGEVVDASYDPDAPPGHPTYRYGCSDTATINDCQATYVKVEGPDLASADGDSGAPFFAFTTAFGVLSGSSASGSAKGQTYYIIYSSTDWIYDWGYSLHYGS